MGAFFAVETHDAGTSPTAPWRPLRELLDQPRRLDERVHSVRAALAGGGPVARIELRVAASITHLGVVARLLAPTIGAAALGLERAALGSDDLWWQDQLGGPFPLSIVDFTSGDAGPLVGSAVEAITVATAACYALSPQVLWGNVASAANSAAALIAGARPDDARRAYAAADRVLADPRIEGGRRHAGPSFRRNSCCLIYRIADTKSAVCGDCVLVRS